MHIALIEPSPIRYHDAVVLRSSFVHMSIGAAADFPSYTFLASALYESSAFAPQLAFKVKQILDALSLPVHRLPPLCVDHCFCAFFADFYCEMQFARHASIKPFQRAPQTPTFLRSYCAVEYTVRSVLHAGFIDASLLVLTTFVMLKLPTIASAQRSLGKGCKET